MPVQYVLGKSPRNAMSIKGEHLRNCSSSAVGEMHTSPQAPWHLGHPHSASGCTKEDLLRSSESQVHILNRQLSWKKSLQFISPVITASAICYWSPTSIFSFGFQLFTFPFLYCTPQFSPKN